MNADRFGREAYLGDGLYASFDGFCLWLRAPRENGDHLVALDPQVFADFLEFAIKMGFGEIIRNRAKDVADEST